MEEKTYTAGELARISGVTIRTIQHYDQIGLLISDQNNNRNLRYYTENDLLKLQQILFYRKLGLSLPQIKEHCLNYQTRDDLKEILKKQHALLFQKETELKTNIAVIEAILTTLEAEKEAFGFEAIMELTLSLNKANITDYTSIKLDSQTEDQFAQHFPDYNDMVEIYWKWKRLVLEAFSLKQSGIDPQSEAGFKLGKRWDAFIQTATAGDTAMLEAYSKSSEQSGQWPKEDKFLLDFCEEFINQAHQNYCRKKGESD